MNAALLNVCARLTALTLALAAAACGGPLTPSVVEGEPVCPDFSLGATSTKMRGSLRHPVQVTVLEDDKVISRALLNGIRTKDAQPSRVLIPDDNGEYEVRWTQCPNEFAPRPVVKEHESKEAAQYECGKAEPYKTEKIVTRKGDASSRKLTFATPPKTDCWAGETPPEPTAAPGADAGTATDAGTDADAGTPLSADP